VDTVHDAIREGVLLLARAWGGRAEADPPRDVRTWGSYAEPQADPPESDTPRLDAELLLAHALSCSRTELYLCPERALSPEEYTRYQGLLSRRAEREPIAYIIGEREFYGLSFAVGTGVLIPRPETEMIIERAAALPARPARVADIGTGSGALAITLTRLFPGARVWASELSPEAFRWALQNAARLLSPDERARLTLMNGDLFAGADGEFDLIVSNPPYLSEGEYRACMPDVRRYEPREALLAAEEGLAVYRRIVAALPHYLAPSGRALLEISGSVEAGVRSLARQAGLACRTENDLAGHTRLAILTHLRRS